MESPPPTFGKKYPVCPVLTALSSNDKAKSLFPSWKSDQLNNLNIPFVSVLLLLTDIYASCAI